MVPATVLAIPVFMIVRGAGLLDSLVALVLAYSAFLLPYAILLLRNFFDQIPRSLDMAARMDGCSPPAVHPVCAACPSRRRASPPRRSSSS